jgi:hypothetical protein
MVFGNDVGQRKSMILCSFFIPHDFKRFLFFLLTIVMMCLMLDTLFV